MQFRLIQGDQSKDHQETLSSAQAPNERFVCLGGRAGSDGKRESALPFLSLPRPTVKAVERSQRGLCGGQRSGNVKQDLTLKQLLR